MVIFSTPSLAVPLCCESPTHLLVFQVWGSKKFELQPATSAARSHGVFHDRIKTLYTVFESSKKGVDLQMTACVPPRSIALLHVLHDFNSAAFPI
jgi:hypothetical protein